MYELGAALSALGKPHPYLTFHSKLSIILKCTICVTVILRHLVGETRGGRRGGPRGVSDPHLQGMGGTDQKLHYDPSMQCLYYEYYVQYQQSIQCMSAY